MKSGIYSKLFPIILCLFYFSLPYLNNEYFIQSKHYFVLFTSIVVIWWCCKQIITDKKIRINVLDGAILMLIIYLIFNALIVSGFGLLHQSHIILCSVLLAYIVTKHQIGNLQAIISIFILLSGIIQCLWGILQQFGIVNPDAGIFITIGSFQNPGIYANYIACIFPLALSLLLGKSNRKIMIISSVFLVLSLFIMPFTQARTAWISILIGSIVVTQYHYKWLQYFSGRTKILIPSVFIAVIIIVAAGYRLYNLKPESVQGRMLIYKITVMMSRSNILQGKGYGTFPKEYNLSQAKYFASGYGNAEEEYLAACNSTAFNEYLQFFAEVGLVGLIILLSIPIILMYYRKSMQTPNSIGAMGVMISLIFSACFSYPFHEISIMVIAVCMLAIISNEIKAFQLRMPGYIKYVCLLLAITLFLCSTSQLRNIRCWETVVFKTTVEGFENTFSEYEQLYKKLKNNPYFLYNYGMGLISFKEYGKGVEVLNEACRYFTDTDILCGIGDGYKGMYRYDLAEEAYILASNMVPNKFYPQYCLAKLYNETNRPDAAIAIANSLIYKKEKIQSYTTYKIKKEMMQLVDSLTQKSIKGQ